jgi:ion channel POLLUX/CASTOR
MLQHLKNRCKFRLERIILRGAHYRLLVMAAAIGLVAAAGGILVWKGDQGFSSSGEAIWWAFLRLTDPGYLGDDEGVFRRIVSTVVTVLGYVLFMGALIAIMTQWLSQTISKLESGLTPIAQRGHILILGWTNRTPSIVEQLVRSEEGVPRFLRRRGTRNLRIVILAEEVTAELLQELRQKLGEEWNPNQIILRSGNPLHMEHLHRVDFQNAAAIILPGADFALGGAEFNDTRMVKTLLSISHHTRAEGESELPALVAEIFDPRKVLVGASAYGGPVEVLASNAFISRLIAQTVRHPGLSYVYSEILTQGDGNELYIRPCSEFCGARLQDLSEGFAEGILLGAVRPHGSSFTSLMNPPGDFILEENDRLVVLAESSAAASPAKDHTPSVTEMPRRPGTNVSPTKHRRVLILGWNHKVPALLDEFSGYGAERFDIDVLSSVPISDREEDLKDFDLDLQQLELRHLRGDFTIPTVLRKLHPEAYDNVVLLSSDRLDSGEASDARSVMGYLLLREILAEHPTGTTHTVIELMDEANLSLFEHRRAEILVSPLILSHMLGQVAVRRELRAVFDEIFGPDGAEIYFRPAADYGAVDVELSFGDLQHRAAAHGEIALGVRIDAQGRIPGGGVSLNPDRSRSWRLSAEDEVVVLTTYS